MASKDARRLNPGIQVDLLYVGIGSAVDPHLERKTSEVSNMGIKNSQILSGGANPSAVYALQSADQTSGSLIMLIPA